MCKLPLLLPFASLLTAASAHAALTSYQLTGIFDFPPEVSAYDNNLGQDLDTTDWGLLPQLFGAAYTLTFDIDEDTLLTSSSGGFSAAFYNFDSAASNVSLLVDGIPITSATFGDIRQVLAQVSHTWSMNTPEGTLNGPPLELFDFLNGGFTGYTVERPSLSINLFDTDENAYVGVPNSLITLSDSVFIGDADIPGFPDSLTLFLSSPEDAEVFISYNITGTISSLSVIPEPSSVLMLAFAAMTTLCRRRVAA